HVLRIRIVDRQRRPFGQTAAGLEDEFAPRIVEDVFHLRLAEACVDGNRDSSGKLNAIEGQTPVETVAQPNRHAIAGHDSGFLQASGNAGAAVPELTIRHSSTADFDDRLGLRRFVDRRAEHFHERRRQPLITFNPVGAPDDSRLIERLNGHVGFPSRTSSTHILTNSDSPRAAAKRLARRTAKSDGRRRTDSRTAVSYCPVIRSRVWATSHSQPISRAVGCSSKYRSKSGTAPGSPPATCSSVTSSANGRHPRRMSVGGGNR